MEQQGGSDLEDLRSNTLMLCFGLAVLCADSAANRPLEVSSQFGPDLMACFYDLIGDGDICKIFSLVTLLLRYSNAVKRQEMLGPFKAQDKVKTRGPCNSIGIFRIWLW